MLNEKVPEVPTCPKCGNDTMAACFMGGYWEIECWYCLHRYETPLLSSLPDQDDPDLFTTFPD